MAQQKISVSWRTPKCPNFGCFKVVTANVLLKPNKLFKQSSLKEPKFEWNNTICLGQQQIFDDLRITYCHNFRCINKKLDVTTKGYIYYFLKVPKFDWDNKKYLLAGEHRSVPTLDVSKLLQQMFS